MCVVYREFLPNLNPMLIKDPLKKRKNNALREQANCIYRDKYIIVVENL